MMRAAARQVHAVEAFRRQRRELRAELRVRRVRGVREAGEEGKLASLLRQRLRHLLVAIADVHTPQAADAVEIALAIGVVDVGTLAPGDNQGPLLVEGGQVGEGVQDVVVVLLPKVFRVVVG
jgi:hypothetical protein